MTRSGKDSLIVIYIIFIKLYNNILGKSVKLPSAKVKY